MEYEKLRIEREKIREDAERRMKFVDESIENELGDLPPGRLNRFDQNFDEKSVKRLIFVTDLHMGHRLHEKEIDDSLVRPLRSLVGKEEDVILIFGGDQVNNNMQEKFYEKVFELDRRIRIKKDQTEEEEGEKEEEMEEYEAEDEKCGGRYQSVFYAAGNHDMSSSHDTTGLDFRKKFLETYGKSFGTFTIGKTMKVIVTNTGSGVFGLKQMRLLEESLQDRHEYQFCVLVSHYSFTWRNGNHFRDWEEIAEVTKLLKTYSVDASFCGHTHQWEYGEDCGLHHFTLSHRKLGTIPVLDIRINGPENYFTVERFLLRPKYEQQLKMMDLSTITSQYPKVIPSDDSGGGFTKKKIFSKHRNVQSKLNTILNSPGIFIEKKKKKKNNNKTEKDQYILELGNHGNNMTFMIKSNTYKKDDDGKVQSRFDIGGPKKDSFRMNEFSWWCAGKDSEEDGSTKASETYIWDESNDLYIQIKNYERSGYFHPNCENMMDKNFVGLYSCDRGRSFPIRISFSKGSKYIHFFFSSKDVKKRIQKMKNLFLKEEDGKDGDEQEENIGIPELKLEELNPKCFRVELVKSGGVLYMMWIQRMVRCINPSFFWIFVKNESAEECISIFSKK